jgi:predicted permease
MHFTAFAVGLDDEIRGPVRPVLWLLVGGVVCLLLIACANVGNLLLVRGEARQREFALRAALGAGPGRLARDTLIEALVLALAGTAAGLPLAVAGLRVVSRYQPATLHAFGTLALYWPMVLLAMVAAVATTAGFSLAPVLGRTTVSHTLRDSGTHTTASGTRARTRRLLVLLEVGIATILLIAAGLVLRSIDALRRIDLGFNPAHVVTMRVALPETRYRTPEQIVQFYERLRNDAQALAGVRAAGVMRLLPLATTMGDWGLDIDGFDETSAKAKGDWQIVTDGAFEAMGIHLLRGRWFEASDRTTTEPVAVVNETLARTYWRSMDEAIGGRMRIGSEPARPWIRVIGIVADDRHNGVTVAAKEKFYIPHSQWHVVTGGNVVRAAYLVVRADGDPMRLAAPLQHVVEQIDPDLPVGAPRAMTDVVNAALATSSLTGFLLATFAAIALALAAIGIYGVLAYVVSRRAREIGIRIALGSTRSKVVALVVRQGITMGASGIAWGSAAAFALAGLMRGLLYRVAPTDAATFAAVGSLLLGVTTIASIVPAMRACNASLLETLKSD